MKIDFVASNQSLSVGSYRIWINDTQNYFKKYGVDSRICRNISEIRDDSIIIFSKGDYHRCSALDTTRVVGAINVSADDIGLPLDFIIAGSIEEKKSLETNYDNVHIVNLIEQLYENYSLKIHTDKKDLIIGYHGSYTHLFKLTQGFVKVFNKKPHLKFVCLTNDAEQSKTILESMGMPSDRVLCVKWSMSNAANTICSFDMGIVPSVTDFSLLIPTVKTVKSDKAGLYDSDYFLRFKNKTNAGRSFVFIQTGIPVITDLSLSNMPLFHDEKCGALVIDEKTYKMAIERFSDFNERNNVAKLAKGRFDMLYSVDDDIRNLIITIKEIKKAKKATGIN